MTDETKPITVKASAAPVITSETFKAIALGGFAIAADQFMHSETAIVAVLAAAGFMLTCFWGLWHPSSQHINPGAFGSDFNRTLGNLNLQRAHTPIERTLLPDVSKNTGITGLVSCSYRNDTAA